MVEQSAIENGVPARWSSRHEKLSTVAFSFDGRRTSVALALKAIVAQSHLNGRQAPKAARQMQEL